MSAAEAQHQRAYLRALSEAIAEVVSEAQLESIIERAEAITADFAARRASKEDAQ